MKARLHSKKENILIVLTDGSTYHSKLKRTISLQPAYWALSLDTQSHSFWQRQEKGESNFLDMSRQRTRFEKKYHIPKVMKNKSK